MSRAEGNPKPEYNDIPAEQKQSAYWKKYYNKNKKKHVDRVTKYRKENESYREKQSVSKSLKWRDKPIEERKSINLERRLKQRFRRSPEWYDKTLVEQDGHCALCPEVPTTKRHHVDHDHSCCPDRITCGKCIRGLLCSDCNTRLGMLEGILEQYYVWPMAAKEGTWLERALQYLNKFKRSTDVHS